MTSKFYLKDNRTTLGFGKICRLCAGTIDHFTHDNTEVNYIHNNSSKNVYKAYKEGSLIPVYKAYLHGDLKRLPQCFQNKEDYSSLIKYIFNNYKVSLKNINVLYFSNEYRLVNLGKFFTTNEIHELIYGEDVKYYPWKYPSFQMGREPISFEYAKVIFKNYLRENKININDKFTFNYGDICAKARIRLKDLLAFVVYCNDYKFPGYKYSVSSVNYYKNKDNVIFDLKYLIEKDLKLPTNKIPLYLTRNVLQQKCRPLYNFIIAKKNGSIYEWVNAIYPNKYIEADFEVNAYRNEFDSDTECFIHELLINKFRNVIYNQKNTDKTIVIDDMIPDWLVFTNKGVWIIEYFGMYVKRQSNNNSRIQDYIEKTHRKIEKYNKMKGCNFIFLYPEDIEDDFRGCREKLKQIEKM